MRDTLLRRTFNRAAEAARFNYTTNTLLHDLLTEALNPGSAFATARGLGRWRYAYARSSHEQTLRPQFERSLNVRIAVLETRARALES